MVYDIAIIGAGPAGLTSAIYARRAEKKVIVFEKKTFGGQIVNATDIENYPGAFHLSGFELAKKMYEQAVELGAEFEFLEVKEIKDGDEKEIVTEDGSFFAKTIIIATGAKNRELGLENERELIGHGVSYCATCDGAFYRDKTVAIQGGGNVALEDAIYLSKVCKEVFLIHRGEKFRAETKLVDNLKNLNNVKTIMNSRVVELLTNENGNLKAVKIEDQISKETRELEADGLFIAIGQVPDTAELSNLLALDDFGYIESNENCQTNVSGIFVAGDCREKNVRQLVTATNDGAISALSAIKYLND